MPDSTYQSKPVVRVCQTCFENLQALSERTSHRVAQSMAVFRRPTPLEIMKLPAAWDALNAIEEETAEVARLQGGGCTHLK